MKLLPKFDRMQQNATEFDKCNAIWKNVGKMQNALTITNVVILYHTVSIETGSFVFSGFFSISLALAFSIYHWHLVLLWHILMVADSAK